MPNEQQESTKFPPIRPVQVPTCPNRTQAQLITTALILGANNAYPDAHDKGGILIESYEIPLNGAAYIVHDYVNTVRGIRRVLGY